MKLSQQIIQLNININSDSSSDQGMKKYSHGQILAMFREQRNHQITEPTVQSMQQSQTKSRINEASGTGAHRTPVCAVGGGMATDESEETDEKKKTEKQAGK